VTGELADVRLIAFAAVYYNFRTEIVDVEGTRGFAISQVNQSLIDSQYLKGIENCLSVQVLNTVAHSEKQLDKKDLL
jgi:hypothetical protein